MHNFVLAHPSCNRSKSNTLAAKQHLARWLEFIDIHHNDMKEIGIKASINADAQTTLSVARWSYSNALSSGGQAWIKANTYESVVPNFLDLL